MEYYVAQKLVLGIIIVFGGGAIAWLFKKPETPEIQQVCDDRTSIYRRTDSSVSLKNSQDSRPDQNETRAHGFTSTALKILATIVSLLIFGLIGAVIQEVYGLGQYFTLAAWFIFVPFLIWRKKPNKRP